MKTLTFNKNSYHHKLARFGIDAFTDVSEDICGYVRQVMAGLMKLIILVVCVGTLGGIAAKVVVDMVLGIIFIIYYGTILLTSAGEAGVLISCLLLVTFLMFKTFSWYFNKKRKPFDNFVTHAYSSFRQKYCAKINFV